MKITLVIPTYNEAENLPKLVSALFSLPMPELSILVVDDNSPDGTGQIAERLKGDTGGRVQVLHRAGKQGLGTAYIQGWKEVLKTDSQAVCQMDADFSHPPEKLVELALALENGKGDIIIGSRYTPGGSLDEQWPLWRKALSAWGNFYARTILGLKPHDVTGGFRLWSRKVIETMPLDRIRASGYIFQVETAYLAQKLGFTFSEVPIYFAERRLGKSKMSFRIQVEAALRVWQVLGRYNDIKPVR